MVQFIFLSTIGAGGNRQRLCNYLLQNTITDYAVPNNVKLTATD